MSTLSINADPRATASPARTLSSDLWLLAWFVALAASILVNAFINHDGFISRDGSNYLRLAQQLVNGGGYVTVPFDVTGQGAGVEVFQPLEIVEGRSMLREIPNVKDGDQLIKLSLASLGANERLVFTIDVDDTIGAREITVSNAEYAGGTLSISVEGETQQAAFAARPKLSVPVGECAS